MVLTMSHPTNTITILTFIDDVWIFNISSYSLLSSGVIFFGYLIQSSLLQMIYWQTSISNEKQIKSWKIQPNNRYSVGKFFFHPFLSKKPNRGEYHRLFASINLIVASFFAATATEFCYRGYSKLSYENVDNFNTILSILFGFIVIVLYENITEYYWHRIMHIKLFYLRFHKYHHYYKSPEPFDDMYIHPVEAFGYYCILYSPPFLFPVHFYSFLCYMVVMGMCGVIDHSGIKFEIPYIYNSIDHDMHHQRFNVNYGFPCIYLDILHGTYEGLFGNIKFSPEKHLSYDPIQTK